MKITGVIRHTFILLFVILVLHALIEARNYLYPIAVAALFAYMLYPVECFLEEKLKIPRILANLLTIILAAGVLIGITILIYWQLRGLAHDFPNLKQQALRNVDSLYEFVQSNFGITEEKQRVFLKESVAGMLEGGNQYLSHFFTATAGTILRSVILPVYIFLMLYYRDKLRDFLYMLFPTEKHASLEVILQETSQVTKQYVGGLLIIFFILAIVNATGFYFIGLKYAIMLGIIAAFCNFIPYFGTIIGYSFPILYTFFTQESPHMLFAIITQFFVVQFTENNILVPNIVGNNVRLSPLVIILGLVGSTMVWGVPGMLLIVPILAVLRIICENTPKYKAYAYLLGTEGTQKHAITWQNIKAILKKRKIDEKLTK